MARDPNECCPHCGHFVDWHQGLPFNGGPHGEWRYRCSCGCTVDGDLNALDPVTFAMRASGGSGNRAEGRHS